MKNNIKEISRNIYLEADKNNKLQYSSVTCRMDSRTCLMLREMSNTFNFPISITFSDVISSELCNILLNLDEEKLNEVLLEFNSCYEVSAGDDRLDYLGAIPLLREILKDSNTCLNDIYKRFDIEF